MLASSKKHKQAANMQRLRDIFCIVIRNIKRKKELSIGRYFSKYDNFITLGMYIWIYTCDWFNQQTFYIIYTYRIYEISFIKFKFGVWITIYSIIQTYLPDKLLADVTAYLWWCFVYRFLLHVWIKHDFEML